jgi:hypothetical protein
MPEVIAFDFGDVRLEHDPASGHTTIRYPDGASSGCGVVEGDRYHAPRLGISPERHRLMHELLHVLVARALYGPGAGVVWRDAHHTPQEAGGWAKPGWSEAEREEWGVTALTYRLCSRRPEHPGGLEHLYESGVDVGALAEQAAWLLNAVDHLPHGGAIVMGTGRLRAA